MVFGFLRKKKQPATKQDPLATFDGILEDLERQGTEVRRSAATLLALRGDLTRAQERQRARLTEIRDRLTEANTMGDARAASVLERDEATAQRLLASTEESLARATVDAELLLEAAQGLARQVTELRAERTSAQARLTAGLAVTETMKQRSEELAKLLQLDAARDEIERAHALAEIYREEKG